VRTEGFEDLLEVDLHRVACVAGVPKHGTEGLALGEFLDECFVQAGIEAGGEGVLGDEEDAAFEDFLLGDG